MAGKSHSEIAGQGIPASRELVWALQEVRVLVQESPLFVTRLTAFCAAVELRLSLQGKEFLEQYGVQERHNRVRQTRRDTKGRVCVPIRTSFGDAEVFVAGRKYR